MDSHKKPLANPTVVLRKEFDDWAVLFNPDTAEAVGIDPVGVVAWELLDGERTIEQIAHEISDRFAEVPDSVTQDIAAFVTDLLERGFVGLPLEVA